MGNDISDGISRRTVLKAAGTAGVGAAGIAAMSGTAAANCPCEGRTLGKIEEIDGTDLQDLTVGVTYEVTLTLEKEQRIRTDCAACDEDQDVTVEVTPTETNRSGDVTCVKLEIKDTNGKCKCADDGLYFNGAEVKGGPEVATYDCGDVVNNNQDFSRIPNACAPVNSNNGQRYGISNIVIEVCVFDICYDSDTVCAEDGGS